MFLRPLYRRPVTDTVTDESIIFITWAFYITILYYIFYHADEDFSASATCLFSNNALSFLPVDALADTGEYTSKRIIELISPS